MDFQVRGVFVLAVWPGLQARAADYAIGVDLSFLRQVHAAFIAMPGGYGTAEEFFEALVWAQLSLHAKCPV